MASATVWIRRFAQPAVLGLLAALILGQILRIASRPYVDQPHPSGQIPIVDAAVLGVAVLLAIVVVVLRVQVGRQLAAVAPSLRLPAPVSLPARYAVADPAGRLVGAGLALLDLVLLLL